MTKEEAIKLFNTVLLFNRCDCPKEEIEKCLKMAIKALEQEPGWILCSERLPEKDGLYLCTVDSSYMPIRTMYYAPDEWREDDQNTWTDTSGYYAFNWFVVAWMPLPKPYEGDKE